MKQLKLKNPPAILIVAFLSLIFSFWLMFSTFSTSESHIFISAKAWSDFASHIPLIRSFSLGQNFPPQYPIFAGEPIKYHFLFYFLVGLLEKISIPLDWALNLPSAIGFTLLIVMIYTFSKLIFNKTSVGILAIILFLFNGSLAFLEFFKSHPLSINTIGDIVNNNIFPSFGPYDGRIVSAFWNLNIYTNQRHLSLSFALFLSLLLLFLIPEFKNNKVSLKVALLAGAIIGFYPFLHLAVFVMIILTLAAMLLLFPKLRSSILIALIVGGTIALPQYLYLSSSPSTSSLQFIPGYLASNNLNLFSLINYWFLNLGLHLILIPVGVWLSPPKIRKVFLIFLPLFIVGNLFQFSQEMAANHKFFNLFMIIGVMFSSFTLIKLWELSKKTHPLVLALFLLLTLSGIVDFFPIFNDPTISISDYPHNPKVFWIVKNTPPTSTFLNSDYIYDSASLAGRKIFLGWPYFAWSAGYNTKAREEVMSEILETPSKIIACKLLKENKIDYIESKTRVESILNQILTSTMILKQFNPVFEDPNGEYRIFNVAQNCP